ncbi:MAG: circularly permuted type 2 ATP-grasp protein, partial [Tepidisphaeraceae bacterium]
PDMIKFYLNQDPILPNVPTYICARPSDRQYVLEHLDELVVKSTNESGGYGMLMGHQASAQERAVFAEKINADPRNFIAQPVIQLSQHPSLVEDHFEGRRVDLRPYILYGQKVIVMPGGLTRVALRKGSLVVNSSQGGGSKDTWVLEEE